MRCRPPRSRCWRRCCRHWLASLRAKTRPSIVSVLNEAFSSSSLMIGRSATTDRSSGTRRSDAPRRWWSGDSRRHRSTTTRDSRALQLAVYFPSSAAKTDIVEQVWRARRRSIDRKLQAKVGEAALELGDDARWEGERQRAVAVGGGASEARLPDVLHVDLRGRSVQVELHGAVAEGERGANVDGEGVAHRADAAQRSRGELGIVEARDSERGGALRDDAAARHGAR